jgi:hypothetical protein
MASVLVASFTDPRFSEVLARRGVTEDYSLTAGGNATLAFEVQGSNPRTTQRTLDALVESLDGRLKEVQVDAGSTDNALITASVLSKSVKPGVESGSRVRAVAAVGALGLLLTLAVVFLLDALSRARSSRRERSNAYRAAPPTSEMATTAAPKPNGEAAVTWLARTEGDESQAGAAGS